MDPLALDEWEAEIQMRSSLAHKIDRKKGQKDTSTRAGNRTRAIRVGGEYSTTELRVRV